MDALKAGPGVTENTDETEEAMSQRLQKTGMGEGEANMLAAIAFATIPPGADVVEVDGRARATSPTVRQT